MRKIYKPEIFYSDDVDFAAMAAGILFEHFEKATNPLVSFPTGSTPQDTYKELIARYADRRDIWDNMRYLCLDDYAGLPEDDERLFKNWLGQMLLDPLDIKHRILFNSAATDTDDEAANMQDYLDENGPVDVMILGLGGNGHLAFNEPDSAFDSPTRLVDLAQDTIESNARYWGGDISRVPHQGYTLGLGDIMKAKKVFLLVTGEGKADILDKAMNGEITEAVPASILQNHPNVTIIADKSALFKFKGPKHG